MNQLTLIIFTCSTINPKYMFDLKNPENYVSLDPKGNNLEQDLPKLKKFYQQLSKYISVKIIILIGNTDPFYIYTQEGKIFPNISEGEFWNRFNIRWQLYKNNLQQYLKKRLPNIKFEVISWYELEKSYEKYLIWNFRKQFTYVRKNIYKYFSQDDLNRELSSLQNAFGEGKYFYNIKKPPTPILKEWIKRKFAEYAVQGLWIKQIFAEAILLQNEKPSFLRTKMYQPLIKKYLNSSLPVIYPFGVDNLGFQ